MNSEKRRKEEVSKWQSQYLKKNFAEDNWL